jgi:soluble cytochrome b562
MKKIFIVLPLLLLTFCSDNSDKISQLQKQIDSLQSNINSTYQSGFGEFMTNIQIHHAKLWFAGINQNWRLAEFEVEEIHESLEDIQKFQSAREETKTLPIIFAPLDSVLAAVNDKSLNKFKQSFTLLTNTCNACHKAVKNEFNKIKIPESPPFSNQIFKIE